MTSRFRLSALKTMLFCLLASVRPTVEVAALAYSLRALRRTYFLTGAERRMKTYLSRLDTSVAEHVVCQLLFWRATSAR
ncbi:hypothetical protein GE09DRAFT_358016 [Coniochaeta sp. 2T2.1]|nr:hypothetical protein GE09DRAFT_358016 [Coniochaeta sp. 2T2.1]